MFTSSALGRHRSELLTQTQTQDQKSSSTSTSGAADASPSSLDLRQCAASALTQTAYVHLACRRPSASASFSRATCRL